MLCSCWSAWNLQALPPCCNKSRIVRANCVPSSGKFFPCGRWMFQSLSLPCFPLKSFQTHLASTGGEGLAPIGRDQASTWIWTRDGGGRKVKRTRSSAGACRWLISNMLCHFLDTNIFPPPFIFSQAQWQSPVLGFQMVPISGALSCPYFVSCLSQNKGLPSIQSKQMRDSFITQLQHSNKCQTQ